MNWEPMEMREDQELARVEYERAAEIVRSHGFIPPDPERVVELEFELSLTEYDRKFLKAFGILEE